MNLTSLRLHAPGETNDSIIINLQRTKNAAAVLRALHHPLRQQMLLLIDRERECTVTTIYTALNMVQSDASQHLAILRRAQLVLTTRKGKYIYYSIHAQKLAEIDSLAAKLASPNQ